METGQKGSEKTILELGLRSLVLQEGLTPQSRAEGWTGCDSGSKTQNSCTGISGSPFLTPKRAGVADGVVWQQQLKAKLCHPEHD